MERIKCFFIKSYRIVKKVFLFLNYDPVVARIQKVINQTKSNDPIILKKRLEKSLAIARIIRNKKMKNSGFFIKCYLFLFFGFFIRQAIWKLNHISKKESDSVSSHDSTSLFQNSDQTYSSRFGDDNPISAVDMLSGSDSFTNSATSQPMTGTSVDISGNVYGTTSLSDFYDYRH